MIALGREEGLMDYYYLENKNATRIGELACLSRGKVFKLAGPVCGGRTYFLCVVLSRIHARLFGATRFEEEGYNGRGSPPIGRPQAGSFISLALGSTRTPFLEETRGKSFDAGVKGPS
jgi:hypothetical protein